MTMDARPHTHAHERGFTLVTAVFLIVVISLLASGMAAMNRTHSFGLVLNQLGTRAELANQTALSWVQVQINNLDYATRWSSCPEGSTALAASFDFGTLGGDLDVLRVDVECMAVAYEYNHNDMRWVYVLSLTATGMQGAVPGDPNYAERVWQRRVHRP